MAINNGAGYAVGAKALAVDGAGAANTAVGDVFAIEGDKYVVTARTGTSINIEPGLRQAVADNDTLTFVNEHRINVIGSRRGLVYAMPQLVVPRGAGADRTSFAMIDGIGVRVVFDYSSANLGTVVSFDTMIGAVLQQPEALVRILR